MIHSLAWKLLRTRVSEMARPRLLENRQGPSIFRTLVTSTKGEVADKRLVRITLQVLFAAMTLLGGIQAHAAEKVTYYYTDQQGTPLATVDGTTGAISAADYHPYGLQASGTLQNGPGYTDHVVDLDSELVYMQARYYDASIGRFLSVDPLDRGPSDITGFTPYGYARGNPSTYIDEDGLEAVIPTLPPTFVTAPAPRVPPNAIRLLRALTAIRAAAAAPIIGAGLFFIDSNTFNREVLGQAATCYGEITCAAQPNTFDLNKIDGFKVRRPGLSGKEAASDVPSKYRGARPKIGQNGKDFADEVVGKDPPGGKGPGSDWSKVRKYGDRGFQDP